MANRLNSNPPNTCTAHDNCGSSFCSSIVVVNDVKILCLTFKSSNKTDRTDGKSAPQQPKQSAWGPTPTPKPAAIGVADSPTTEVR